MYIEGCQVGDSDTPRDLGVPAVMFKRNSQLKREEMPGVNDSRTNHPVLTRYRSKNKIKKQYICIYIIYPMGHVYFESKS